MLNLRKMCNCFIEWKRNKGSGIKWKHLLFDCCGMWIRDGSGDIRPIVDDPAECGTGIESDGNPIVSTGE
jgi:hypothetical protein